METTQQQINKIYNETRHTYIKCLMKVVTAKPTKSLKKIIKNKDDLSFIKDCIEDLIITDNLNPVYKKDNINYIAFYDDEPYQMSIENHRIMIQKEILIFLTEKIADIDDYIYSYILHHHQD